MIDQIELWQTRANTSGQLAIGVHMEEISEWLDSLTFKHPHIQSVLETTAAHLHFLSTEVKKGKEVAVIKNREGFLDAVADQIVTATAAGCRNGMNVSAAVAEVNRSNWSKFDDNGMPIYDENGKVKKGPNYVKANLKGMF